MATNRSLARVDELDGLRATLALWVASSHMLCWCGFLERTESASGIFGKLSAAYVRAASSVETFMILSGFAISFLLTSRSQAYPAFLVGRFFRLYPVYLVCLILGIACTHLVPLITSTAQWHTAYFAIAEGEQGTGGDQFLAHLFWHLTLLNGVLPHHILPYSDNTFLVPAWSITLEWQYYLVAPLIALLIRWEAGAVVLGLVCLGGHYFGHYWMNTHGAFLPLRLPLFLLGVASFHLYQWTQNPGPEGVRKFSVPTLIILGLVILTGCNMLAVVFWSLAFGCIFVRGNGILSKSLLFLRHVLLLPWLQFIGQMSYVVYLIHWPLILGLLALGLYVEPRASSNEMAIYLIAVGMPLILAVSALLHYGLELPGMALGKKLAKRLDGALQAKPRLEAPKQEQSRAS